MTDVISLARGSLLAVALAGGLAATAVHAQEAAAAPAAKPARTCFYLSDWHGWTSPDRDTLYLKVRSKDVYRLDLAHGSSQLQWPGSHLVSVVRGSDRICSPIDLDLSVSDGYSMSIPIRAKTITKMTPEEIAAIPKKYRP